MEGKTMKYILIIGDGMADYPVNDLNGKTPLQVANHPYMDEIVSKGICGTLKTIPKGMQANTDVAILPILGYNPKKLSVGRGPLEAASMGVRLDEDEIVLRCNLITEKDGVLLDYSAGHITTPEAKKLIESVDSLLGRRGEISFYNGVSYRHLLVLKGKGYSDKINCFPPHDVMNTDITKIMVKPTTKDGNKTATLLNNLILRSKEILRDNPVNKERVKAGKNPANMIWPWGQGKKPKFVTLQERFHIKGVVISAVDVIKGMGVYAGMDVINVPGATGYVDTNYEGKAAYALESLKDHDFVLVHVEAPDEAGHTGDSALKIKTIQDLDRRLIGRIMSNLRGDYTIAVLADHMTPVATRTHAADPVPFAMYSTINELKSRITHFDEESVKKASYEIKRGHRFLSIFLDYGLMKK